MLIKLRSFFFGVSNGSTQGRAAMKHLGAELSWQQTLIVDSKKPFPRINAE